MPTYTPVITNTANIATITPHTCHWCRINDEIIVSGIIDVVPVTVGQCVFDMSLPEPSVFLDRSECAGTAVARALQGECSSIHGADGVARWDWKTGYPDTQNGMSFLLKYKVASIIPVPVP